MDIETNWIYWVCLQYQSWALKNDTEGKKNSAGTSLSIQRQDGPAGNAAKRGALYSYEAWYEFNMKRQNENPQRHVVKQQQGGSAIDEAQVHQTDLAMRTSPTYWTGGKRKWGEAAWNLMLQRNCKQKPWRLHLCLLPFQCFCKHLCLLKDNTRLKSLFSAVLNFGRFDACRLERKGAPRTNGTAEDLWRRWLAVPTKYYQRCDMLSPHTTCSKTKI